MHDGCKSGEFGDVYRVGGVLTGKVECLTTMLVVRGSDRFGRGRGARYIARNRFKGGWQLRYEL